MVRYLARPAWGLGTARLSAHFLTGRVVAAEMKGCSLFWEGKHRCLGVMWHHVRKTVSTSVCLSEKEEENTSIDRLKLDNLGKRDVIVPAVRL